MDESRQRMDDLLLPLPRQMTGRPFGQDGHGHAISEVRGSTVGMLLHYLERRAEHFARQQYGSAAFAEDARTEISYAGSRARNELIRRLNEAIVDPAYHVTAESLKQASLGYSYEFFVYAVTFCQEILNDEHFAYNWIPQMGIPTGWIAYTGLGLGHVYSSLPFLIRFMAHVRLQCERVSNTQVVVRQYVPDDFREVPPVVAARLIVFTKDMMAGLLSELPRIHANLPPAEVIERKDLLRGDPYSEWEVTWTNPKESPFVLIGNVAATVVFMLGLVLGLTDLTRLWAFAAASLAGAWAQRKKRQRLSPAAALGPASQPGTFILEGRLAQLDRLPIGLRNHRSCIAIEMV